MADVSIGEGEFLAPAAENAAELFQEPAQQIMNGNSLFRQILLASVLVQDTGGQDGNVGVGFHIGNHPAQQSGVKSHVRIHDQMVSAFQVGQHGVVGAAEADVSLLREYRDARKQPFHFFGGQILRRIVRQKDVHFQVGVLNTAQGMGEFVPAVIQHNTGGKKRSHLGTSGMFKIKPILQARKQFVQIWHCRERKTKRTATVF